MAEGFDRTMPMPEAVAMVRSGITPEFPRPQVSLPPGTLTQFTIAYSDETPAGAQRVANRIADVFVQESSAKRAIRAEETSMFILTQVERSQKRLVDLMDKLEWDESFDYKAERSRKP